LRWLKPSTRAKPENGLDKPEVLYEVSVKASVPESSCISIFHYGAIFDAFSGQRRGKEQSSNTDWQAISLVACASALSSCEDAQR
jgi:hypothetical protein